MSFECQSCGADVPDAALACPECGADENTGLYQVDPSDGLDLPGENDGFGGGVLSKTESDAAEGKGPPLLKGVVIAVMLAALLFWILLY